MNQIQTGVFSPLPNHLFKALKLQGPSAGRRGARLRRFTPGAFAGLGRRYDCLTGDQMHFYGFSRAGC